MTLTKVVETAESFSLFSPLWKNLEEPGRIWKNLEAHSQFSLFPDSYSYCYVPVCL